MKKSKFTGEQITGALTVRRIEGEKAIGKPSSLSDERGVFLRVEPPVACLRSPRYADSTRFSRARPGTGT
ncbi:hypothetical protein BLA18112_02002 [Burkholderia lata]|uniref:Uncharacterized protein n=1 Tax=Burkholderia lata (strain ATCC 17760 / DSM 23089 / LMG 22485 / NCIMB 9086 / R18194 / 383) TaxID=482957 RepID=A0A6P2U5E2_BURL3|nr:hypothetical protein [Burkholderia lata]VWC71954.1 hypothetical protein BLA18112_02002 [Burkholderia lata]